MRMKDVATDWSCKAPLNTAHRQHYYAANAHISKWTRIQIALAVTYALAFVVLVSVL